MRPSFETILAICAVQARTVMGNPYNNLKRASNTCAAESVVISLLNKSYAASATTYCRSFIAKSTTTTSTSIPTSRTTTTPTIRTTVTLTATSDIDVTATTSTTVSTTTFVQTVASGTTTIPYPTCDPTPDRLMERDENFALARRGSSSAPCPAPLKSLASSLVSSVCSCIVTLTTSTSTVVKTAAATTVISTASPFSIVIVNGAVISSVTTTVSTETDDVVASTITTTVIPSATSYAGADASYCAIDEITGSDLGKYHVPQCDTSYVHAGAGAFESAATYIECLNLCDEHEDCLDFSFLKTTCTNNCFLLPGPGEIVPDFYTPQPDPNVDSGTVVGPL